MSTTTPNLDHPQTSVSPMTERKMPKHPRQRPTERKIPKKRVEQPKPKPKTADISKNEGFVFFPLDVLLNPPQLPVFELAIMAGLLKLAHQEYGAIKHDMALAVGKLAISKVNHFKYHKRADFAKKGHVTYNSEKTKLKKAPLPKTIRVTITRTGLLSACGLSHCSKHWRNIAQALEVLSHPVNQSPPLVEAFEHPPTGKWLIDINSQWLAPPYKKVYLPLPTRSKAAAARLYLFLHGVRTSHINKKGIEFHTLLKKLGIKRDRRERLNEAVNVTMGETNKHFAMLHKANGGTLRRFNIDTPDVDVLRFVDTGVRREQQYDD